MLRIARRTPSPKRVESSLSIVAKGPKEAGATEWTFAKEIVMLDALLSREKSAGVEVQAIQVGPSVFVSTPGEMFCQFGLDLKAKSRFPFTCPVELANGCVGYVPTEEALGKRGGGYETRLTSYSNLVGSAGRRMVEAGLELLGRMKPGPIPEPPKAPPFGAGAGGIGSQAWSYGNVPAEIE